MENTDLLTSGSLRDENAKALTYRVRGIPNGLDRAGAKSLLLVALEIQDVTIDSLAAASSKQVAYNQNSREALEAQGLGYQQVSMAGICARSFNDRGYPFRRLHPTT